MSSTQLDLEYLVGILRKCGLISPGQEKIIYKKAPGQQAIARRPLSVVSSPLQN